MGQIVRRGKKGRPSKADLAARREAETERELRRSGRRRNVRYTFDFDDFLDDEYFVDDDEDDGRKEKKLELLLKLQGEDDDGEDESTPSRTRHLSHVPAASASDDEEEEEAGKPSKKRKIFGDDDEYEENDDDNENENDYEVRGRKAESRSVESSPGPPSGRLSETPLPDKKTLELILDKLQKKDVYGVYAEPVDPEELPDYHDVIEHPMDFSTVRNKLGNGSYAMLEQFESDVFLICSNAMQYNASDTVYYKQACAIQEQATKKFRKLRVNAERAERLEKEAKSDQRPKSSPIAKKVMKKPVGRPAQEPVGSDFSSGATLANAGDIQNGSNVCQGTSGRIGTIDVPIEGNSLLSDNLDKEELHSGKGPLFRFGRKSAVQDEDRRATYDISTQSTSSSESVFSAFDAESKHLVPVGLYADHSYARSLAHYAATLGPIAWEFASRRIEQALPLGLKYGRGWVGEYEPLPTPVLMLENYTLKEPSFLAKFRQKVDVVKDKVEAEKSGCLKEKPVSIESKPFFLSTCNSASPRNHPQKIHSQNSTESEKKLMRQFELNSQPLPSNQSSVEQSKVPGSMSVKMAPKNRSLSSSAPPRQLNTNGNGTVCLSSSGGMTNNVNKAASLFPHGQEQGPSDPVQLARMESKKSKNELNPSQQSELSSISPAIPSMQRGDDSSNAAAAAARAWMSIGAGAGGFKQASESTISAESLYNPSRDVQVQFRGEIPGMHFQGSYPFHAFMPNTARVGIEGQIPNRPPAIFPQLMAADLSRFHAPSPGQNFSTASVQSRPKRESVPPDLNISFQSSGSPGRPSPGVLVDSQQPDLALQL